MPSQQSIQNQHQPENFGQEVKAFRLAMGLRQDDLAASLGITRSYLSEIENGEPCSSRLMVRFRRLSETHGHPGNPLNRRETVESPQIIRPAARGRLVKVVSWAQAGEATDFEEIAADWQEEVATDCTDANAIGVQLRGDSMTPNYHEGDTVVMMPSREPRSGCLVVAKLRGEGVAFKIYNEPTRGIIRLSSYNQSFLPIERRRDDFEWIIPVFEMRRNLWR